MFITLHFCVLCDGLLTENEVMYSSGRCPECGFLDKDAVTVVKTYTRGAKIERVPSGKWWKPDNKRLVVLPRDKR